MPQQLKLWPHMDRPYDRSHRGLSRWHLQARTYATRMIEYGYLQDNACTHALIPYLWKMHYDDALVCGAWRLELVYLNSGMPHFRLYYRGRVFGVVDIYADKADIGSSRKTPLVRQLLAAFLVFWGWTPEKIRERPGLARTDLEADTKHQYRLFKVKMDKKRDRDYDLFHDYERVYA